MATITMATITREEVPRGGGKPPEDINKQTTNNEEFGKKVTSCGSNTQLRAACFSKYNQPIHYPGKQSGVPPEEKGRCMFQFY